MRPDGFVLLDDILKLFLQLPDEFVGGFNLRDCSTVVKNDKKQRMKLTKIENQWHIRANQGHNEQT
eukprot:UN05292